MAKKANGEGNLKQLPSGVWECVIILFMSEVLWEKDL